MCGCGCRGWCTLYPLLLAWTDDLVGLQFGNPAYAVLDVLGDWPAFLQIFGLRYWSHKLHPCPLCRVNQDQIQQLHIDDATLDSLPFEAYNTADYRADLEQAVKAPRRNFRFSIDSRWCILLQTLCDRPLPTSSATARNTVAGSSWLMLRSWA